MEVDASKKPSGLDTMGDLFSSLPKTRPPKQGFLPRREPSSRSTKGIPAKRLADQQELIRKLSLKPKTRGVVSNMFRNPGKYNEKIDEALDLIKKHEGKSSDDELIDLLGKLRLGGRTRRRKNKRNHKNKRKTKRSSY